MPKKKSKKKITKTDNRRLLLVLIMFIFIIIAMISYWIYAYNHKYNNQENKLISIKVENYSYIEGNLIYLKNIDSTINKSLINNQKKVLTKNITNTDIKREINNNILSIKINYTIEEKSSNYEYILTSNIDLENNKVISNDDILEKINTTYKEIATDIFNEYIKLPDNSFSTVKDSITDEVMTNSQFNKNSEKYIIRIREKLPDIINLYIEDKTVNYIVNLDEIYKVCYYKDSTKNNINKEIGKL